MKFISYIIKLACNVAEGIRKGGDFFGFEGCDPAIHRLSRELLGEMRQCAPPALSTDNGAVLCLQ